MKETKRAQEETRLRGSLAVQLILELTAKAAVGLKGLESATGTPDVILAMASFTSEQDPWTTENSVNEASMHLETTLQWGKWTMIERVLKQKIRPLFTKAKNPAITSEGRKNLHPVPPSRFDGSALDDSTKPWKNTDIYATSVLSWIVSQYEVGANDMQPGASHTNFIAVRRQSTAGSAFPAPCTRHSIPHRRQRYPFQNKRLQPPQRATQAHPKERLRHPAANKPGLSLPGRRHPMPPLPTKHYARR